MSYQKTEDIFNEMSQLTPSYAGITYEQLEKGGLEWPCPSLDHPGTPYLHRDRFTRGKGKFHVVDHLGPAENPDEDYPLILSTGRVLYHYHTGTMTRRVKGLQELSPECLVEISPEDAGLRGLGDGDRVRVASRRGAMEAKTKVTPRSPAGCIFIPFHFAEAAVNQLTLDGTQEFVAGLPEWCISMGLVERGRPVAGGICNPTTDQLFLGSLEDGVTMNGRAVRVRSRARLDVAEVLASRSEVKRGEWEHPGAPFRIVPMGSVAYKMARVAAGLTDATWTLSPKHEWDVAGGTALVLSAGGTVCKPSGDSPTFNQAHPWLEGLLAEPTGLLGAVQRFI